MKNFLMIMWLLLSVGTAICAMIWGMHERFSLPMAQRNPAAPITYMVAAVSACACLAVLMLTDEPANSELPAKK